MSETCTSCDVVEGLTAEEQEILLDLGVFTLDMAGIVDPTPVSDGLSGVISLFRGDFLGAGISVVSMVPYLGDAAKAGKLGKLAKTIAKVVIRTAEFPSSAFAKAARPILNGLHKALDAIPIDSIPANAGEQLLRIKRAISPGGIETLSNGYRLAKNGDFSTPKDMSVFYSGPGQRFKAQHAAMNGGHPIEFTTAGKMLDEKKLYDEFGGDYADGPWRVASKRFAENAQGQVTAFVNGASRRGVFREVEFPVLLENSKVTHINGVPTSKLRRMSKEDAFKTIEGIVE